MESNSVKNIQNNIKKTGEFLKTKRGQNFLVILLIIAVIILGTHIRVQNWDSLNDQTTGEKIPLALDPYYFLRVAETMSEPGEMPECDRFRLIPGEEDCMGWHPEQLHPGSSILIHKIVSVFDGDFSLREGHALNPVVFFALGLFVYFLLVSKLTKSKVIALISSIFLTFTPMYLYRTMAGFADHEAIGMFGFFLLLLGFSVSLKYLNDNFSKTDKKTSRNKILYSVLTGFLIAFSIACWRGIANFNFMIIPLSVLIFWFVKRKSSSQSEERIKKLMHIPLFYIISLIVMLLITPLISGISISGVVDRFMLSSQGILSMIVLGFLVIDSLMVYLKGKNLIKVKDSYEVLSSFIVLLIAGLILLVIMGELSLIGEIFNKMLNPFGGGRVGETVAENRSPSLSDWIQQTGTTFFWIFILGIVFVGREISKKISSSKKRRKDFVLLFVLMLFGIVFSSHSMFSGSEFLKKFVYFAPVLAFIGYSIWLYGREKSESFNIDEGWIIVFSWLLFMLIAARGATRLFFVIIPVVCLVGGVVPVKLYEIVRKNKDELIKTFSWIVLVAVIIGLVISLAGFYQGSLQQARNTGPSANAQWQNAMEWVRENTAEDSLFTHWWDYGYWTETLGERATLSDGGHFQGARRNHMIGRYVLTTPDPASALSFLKSNNATHLLIDSTDIGKYGAYSRIGSGEEMKDRLGYIQTFQKDPQQTRETRNKTAYFYRGGAGLDEDLVYKEGGEEVLLPRQKAALGAIVIETKKNMENESLENKSLKEKYNQPKGIFVYNNKQYEIPIRYLYHQGEIADFGSGENVVDSIVRLVPSINQAQQGVSIDEEGAAIYLTRKVSKSLVSQLFIMDDPFDNYGALELAHKEEDSVVQTLKMQNAIPEDEDLVFYGGLRGPIKIWEAKDIPEDIKVNEEFTQRNPYGEDWKFGMLDELEFRE